MSDKFFLSHFTNDQNATVGIYSIACVFASIINVLAMALIQYLFPKIYKMLSTGEAGSDRLKTILPLYRRTHGRPGRFAGGDAAGLPFFVNENTIRRSNTVTCFVSGYISGVSVTSSIRSCYIIRKKKLLGLSLSAIAVSLVCNYFSFASGRQRRRNGFPVLYSIVFLY